MLLPSQMFTCHVQKVTSTYFLNEGSSVETGHANGPPSILAAKVTAIDRKKELFRTYLVPVLRPWA